MRPSDRRPTLRLVASVGVFDVVLVVLVVAMLAFVFLVLGAMLASAQRADDDDRQHH